MPLRNGKTTPERGDGHRGGTPGPKLGTTERADRNAERFDERRALIALAGRVLGAWGHTVRQLGDGKQVPQDAVADGRPGGDLPFLRQ